jgi:DHA1 family bicyclomycin/chloramphenicol resistance-like MFS transporter
MFRDPRFSSLVALGACSSAAFYGYLAGVSLVFQKSGGLSPTAFSVVFTINAAGMLASTQVNRRLLRRFTPRQLLGADLLVAAAGSLVAVGVSFTDPLNVVALAASLFVAMAGIASLMPNAVALALALHPQSAGSASSVYGATGIVLGALASPLIGAGGGGAPAMTLLMGVALVAALTVYTVGPRRYADAPEAAALEPLEDVFQA